MTAIAGAAAGANEEKTPALAAKARQGYGHRFYFVCIYLTSYGFRLPKKCFRVFHLLSPAMVELSN